MQNRTICPLSQFGGGPFGDDGWAFQHHEPGWASPKQFIIHLPSKRWRTDDDMERGRGLKRLSKRVCGGAIPSNKKGKSND